MSAGTILPRSILLVEDEEGVRAAMGLMLQADGHAIVSARDGAEALPLFVRQRFDLVITDYVMPKMRGDELARRVKSLVPNQPVLMITGCERPMDDCAPIDAVLRKPFSLAALRQVIGRLAP